MRKGWIVGCMFLMAGLLAGCKGSTTQKEPPVEDILKAVQETYGENYLPDTDLDEEMLLCGTEAHDKCPPIE